MTQEEFAESVRDVFGDDLEKAYKQWEFSKKYLIPEELAQLEVGDVVTIQRSKKNSCVSCPGEVVSEYPELRFNRIANKPECNLAWESKGWNVMRI